MYIKRKIQNHITESLFKGKVVVIYGARQVGKTTLVREIAKNWGDFAYFNCDEPDIASALTEKTSSELIDFLGPKRLVIIDEAQRVKNIGLTLKLLIDKYPDRQFLATGSSSFDLAGKINEPLTGRKRVFHLYPLSVTELIDASSQLEENRLLEKRLIFGLYPEVVFPRDDSEKTLREITGSYLYKDILQLEQIRNQDIILDLLKALALQIGGEVSYNELGNLLQVDRKTVARYINLLEKAFVIFRIRPWHKNKRTEIGKLRKIYFYDNGVRNALINNLNPLNLRNDTGALWENFMMSEIIKAKSFTNDESDIHFWRTYGKQEVDYFEEKNGRITALEFKWSRNKKTKVPSVFAKLYPQATFSIVHRENYLDFIT